ncbi:hypothetical protein EDB92DRAFT_1944652 [Lactarius akahatsu]|uniref:Uncharacterized protein n=1 Tax=Lactarius akahatsu TaxID=416441 RepID=A0AAD4LJK0_9AGAM|nr:hypothetical protein EDB92DRAFT_1944652 [Lactarius akahatsu]
MTEYRPDGADVTFTIVETSGVAYEPSDPSDEANLNIQSALAMAYPTPHIFLATCMSVRRRWFISPTTPSTLFAGPGVTSHLLRRLLDVLEHKDNAVPSWAAAIKAFTSALPTVTRPDLFSYRNLCSTGGSGFSSFALQGLGFEEFSKSSSTSDSVIKSLIASAKLIHKAPPSLIWQHGLQV